MDRLLEQGLYKYSIIRPVDADPGPVGGFQALVGFLGLEYFSRLVSPHEASIAVFIVVVQKCIV